MATAKKTAPLKKDGKDKKAAGKKPKTVGRIHHEEMLKQMIQNQMLGDSGPFLAVREAINNSFDARATQICIRFGKFEGQPALFISDNGMGFSQRAINSAMSYADSARSRQDSGTMGANGTGLKSPLGLGDLKQTKLTIFSVNKDFEACKRMELSFDYLVALAKGKTKAHEHVHDVATPAEWNVDLERTTGTTIILTGFDGRRLRGAEQLVKNLGLFITPRAIAYVRIKKEGGSWQEIAPAVFKGKPYTLSFDEKNQALGRVDFELYYGKANIAELAICGKLNHILDFSDLLKTFDKEQKKKLSNAWKLVSGHIYVEKLNVYRTHEGMLNQQYYDAARDQLFELLQLVGSELEALNEEVANKELLAKRETLIQKIIDANKVLNFGTASSEVAAFSPKGSGLINNSTELQISPRQLHLAPNIEKTITLVNKSMKVLELAGAVWKTDSPLFTILSQKDGIATIKVGDKTGKGKITIKGAFGEHVIVIDVSTMPIGPYVSGPGALKPGSIYTYDLYRYDLSDVTWKLESKTAGVLLHAVDKQATITVPDTFPDEQIVLSVRKNGANEDLAIKKIDITDKNGTRAPIVNINGLRYELKVEVYFPDTVAQLDHLNWDEGSVPTIVVNPLFPRLKDLGFVGALDNYLAAIATAALAQQVEDRVIAASNLPALVEAFISDTKEQVFATQALDKEQAKL